MAHLSPNTSIIILVVNGLTTSIKRQKLAEWIKKYDSFKCCLQEAPFKYNNRDRLKVKRWKRIYRANHNQGKTRVVTLISDKDYSTAKKITRDGHYIMNCCYIMASKRTQMHKK